MAEVVLDNVSRVFARGTIAVDAVTLRVEEGELLVLLGPSGSGKSTLLRLIAGLDEVTSGEILLGDRPAHGLRPWQRNVAMVLQQPVLYANRTVKENLSFGLKLMSEGGWPGRWLRQSGVSRVGGVSVEIDSQASWAARLMRIEHLLDRMPSQLAGGEQQRVALGRALARRPKLFLLDEPLTSLDAPLRNELRDEIKSLQQQLGTAMIYVTHDQAEAFALADRIAVMQQGKIEQIGTPGEIYDAPATQAVARLVGFPGGNFLEGDWSEPAGTKVFRTQVESGSISLEMKCELPRQWQPGPVICAIRPEDVRIAADGLAKGVVERVSMMGDHQLVHLRRGSRGKGSDGASERMSIVSKVPRDARLSRGESVQLSFDEKSCHWFHPVTGLRVD